MFNSQGNDYKALSSIYGKIEEVLLTFPGSNSGKTVKVSQLLHEYEGIWKSLHNRVKFYVLANHEDRALHTLVGPDYEKALGFHRCRYVQGVPWVTLGQQAICPGSIFDP
jgi:hypothetical protein